MSAKKVDLVDEIHRASRKNYPRRRVELKGLNDLWQIDLAEMIPYASSNQGYKYILMCINAFSKYGWCKPLKSKGRFEIVKAVQSILQSTTPPKLIQTDRGTEFFNVDFKRLMEKYKIKHYSSFSKLKASIVEQSRVIYGNNSIYAGTIDGAILFKVLFKNTTLRSIALSRWRPKMLHVAMRKNYSPFFKVFREKCPCSIR